MNYQFFLLTENTLNSEYLKIYNFIILFNIYTYLYM